MKSLVHRRLADVLLLLTIAGAFIAAEKAPDHQGR
jgi:hypothetical protein